MSSPIQSKKKKNNFHVMVMCSNKPLPNLLLDNILCILLVTFFLTRNIFKLLYILSSLSKQCMWYLWIIFTLKIHICITHICWWTHSTCSFNTVILILYSISTLLRVSSHMIVSPLNPYPHPLFLLLSTRYLKPLLCHYTVCMQLLVFVNITLLVCF